MKIIGVGLILRFGCIGVSTVKRLMFLGIDCGLFRMMEGVEWLAELCLRRFMRLEMFSYEGVNVWKQVLMFKYYRNSDFQL